MWFYPGQIKHHLKPLELHRNLRALQHHPMKRCLSAMVREETQVFLKHRQGGIIVKELFKALKYHATQGASTLDLLELQEKPDGFVYPS